MSAAIPIILFILILILVVNVNEVKGSTKPKPPVHSKCINGVKYYVLDSYTPAYNLDSTLISCDEEDK